MKKKKVVHTDNLPSRLPVWQTIAAYLALDHWNAQEWLYGAVGLLFVLGWIVAIYNLSHQQETKLFKEDENTRH